MAERDWAQLFTDTFAAPVSTVEVDAWRTAYGDEYPEGLHPFSYISRTELARFVAEIGLREGDRLVDVGCGRGGSALWVAAQSGAALIGIDIAETALAAARERAAVLGLDERCEFVLGRFEELPLPAAAADAVMSVDALLFTPDKALAVIELARVLRPGGRLVFTSWDYHRQPEGRPPQVPDHRPLLEAAGFTVLTYEETVDWRGRQRRVCELLMERVDELAAELGEDRDELRADLVEMQATQECMIRRVLVVAERG